MQYFRAVIGACCCTSITDVQVIIFKPPLLMTPLHFGVRLNTTSVKTCNLSEQLSLEEPDTKHAIDIHCSFWKNLNYKDFKCKKAIYIFFTLGLTLFKILTQWFHDHRPNLILTSLAISVNNQPDSPEATSALNPKSTPRTHTHTHTKL